MISIISLKSIIIRLKIISKLSIKIRFNIENGNQIDYQQHIKDQDYFSKTTVNLNKGNIQEFQAYESNKQLDNKNPNNLRNDQINDKGIIYNSNNLAKQKSVSPDTIKKKNIEEIHINEKISTEMPIKYESQNISNKEYDTNKNKGKIKDSNQKTEIKKVKFEAKPKTEIIRGGGFSDDDEELVKHIQIGMERKNNQSSDKKQINSLSNDRPNNISPEKTNTQKPVQNAVDNRNNPPKNLIRDITLGNSPQKPVQIAIDNLNNLPNNLIKEDILGNSPQKRNVKIVANDNISNINEPRANNHRTDDINALVAVKNRSLSKKKENITDKWQDLNDDWEISLQESKISKHTLIEKPTSLNVNSLREKGKSDHKIKILKTNTPMFDDPSLHIKLSFNTKTIKIENLFLGPNDEEEEEELREEEIKKELNLKNLKYKEKKQLLEQQKKQLALASNAKPNVVKKRLNDDDNKLNEKDKIFQANQKVVRDGQKFDIEKKIYNGGESNFTFQITVPEKLAAPRYENAIEQDERVRILKDNFERKETEKAIYTGPDPNAVITEASQKKIHVEELNDNLFFSPGETNLLFKSGGSNIIGSQKANIKKSELLKELSNNELLNLVKDEQHMYVQTTFKVDQITFVSDHMHQPLTKSVDIKQAEIENSKKKEEPKPEPKYIEIKKDLIKSEIKRILEVPEQNNVEVNLAGEHCQIPETNTLNNLLSVDPKNENGKKLSLIAGLPRADESFFTNIQNYEEENRMNISRVSRLTKLDLDEVWDNSVIENNDHDFFKNF